MNNKDDLDLIDIKNKEEVSKNLAKTNMSKFRNQDRIINNFTILQDNVKPSDFSNNVVIYNEHNIEDQMSNNIIERKDSNKESICESVNKNNNQVMSIKGSINSSQNSSGKFPNFGNQKEKIQILFGLKYADSQKLQPNNYISTTKYSIISFFPKSLLFQFKRAANIYFLIISILTCFDFSPKQPSSMIGTFAFVLIATMIKELIEDYNRYKQDKISNERKVTKLTSEGWIKVKCETLRPGEIVKIFKEEEFSADCLIISTSNSNGYLHIDTKNLDGESNLKEKVTIEEYSKIKNHTSFSGNIKCEKSNENLFNFEGVITADDSNFKTNVLPYNNINNTANINFISQANLINDNQITNKSIFVSIKNIVLKGCTLKNTDFVIGIVIYTGKNTKIMKNSKTPRLKVSKILKIMNILLYSLFAMTILICLVQAGLSLKFKKESFDNKPYIYSKHLNTLSNKNNTLYFFIRVLIFFVAYSNIIPISLYVGLEVVKLMQGFLILYDNDIYDIEKSLPSKCKAADLIEELGQVEFIFSDKTGTLTQNIMILKHCLIGESVFGVNLDPKNINSKISYKNTINGDQTAYNLMKENEGNPNLKLQINNFFNILSLCHSVFPNLSDKGISYQGASPDDIALVDGAAQFGYIFSNKDYNTITIFNEILDKKLMYEHLCEMPFDSDRKRMSVVVKDLQTGTIKLLSKGSDSVMFPRINWEYSTNNEYSACNEVMDIFCKEGLRCLIMAEKEIPSNEWNLWYRNYQKAISRGRELNRFFEEIENDLKYVGVSAIEDKLQEGVGSTINSLSKCGIRIWVLTGDKQDTAIEIAKSCQLIHEDDILINICNQESAESTLINLIVTFGLNIEKYLGDNFITKLQSEAADDSMIEDKHEKYKLDKQLDINELRNHVKSLVGNRNLALIVDGFSLEVILNSYCLSTAFFYLASACMGVVCCRVSPKQKSSVVKLAKTHGEWITLSIGDGANDVPMIMEAHIGVGVEGKEGTQAVRSSDFSIGQFKFLNTMDFRDKFFSLII